MKLYVNTAPYLKGYNQSKPYFYPVGTTFASIGFDSQGVFLQPVDDVNKGAKFDFCMSVRPELLQICFKEVQQLTS